MGQKKTRKGKGRAGGWLLPFLAVSVGAACMAYPFLSNMAYEKQSGSILETYEAQADAVFEAEKARLLEEAQEYNEAIYDGHVQLHDPFSEEVFGDSVEGYSSQLSVDGSDIIGVLEVPCIGISLPVYHGTAAETLNKGIGHLEGTSLPIGGESTHCVLTGHTGLDTAKMFTDLTEVQEGDVFFLEVLGEKLAYEVDQTKVVEPSELSDLSVVPGMDYCTLVTCTPYGLNTHRLLVRGVRTDYTEAEEAAASVEVRTSGQWMKGYVRALTCASATVAASLGTISYVRKRKERRRKRRRMQHGRRMVMKEGQKNAEKRKKRAPG